jgi:ABC-type spermidine/putrescine transport system permease subunit I
MNKKGQMIVLNIMIGMIAIIAAIVMIEPLKDVIDIGRTDLDCSNYSTLTTGESMTCIIMDFVMPAFIGTAIAIGIAYLGAKTIGNT